ncbi:4'-phosphopantetheinyl transferase family protein [Frateuria soli]|uniref:4'-phosphopantetheinyl transferase family protein n=1 Tax=Frateuria soli TaxID=1542730 RepID=UPI001E5EF57B|nr:4'-phosphopantetheinyl transferase superfamily protein [Frateuria soli]UGB38082.1 4'-phosphopantetheinyl transferase superfamily protein [Frateuria soli]
MPISSAEVPAVASQLDDETLHVWRLPYDPGRGRAPLVALLAGYLGVTAGAIRLVEGPHGRPQLVAAGAGTLDFNWSHSGDCALVALGRGIVPGIDVERRRPRPRALALARRYFHPVEATWLAAQPTDQRDEAFLALWTAKEAVLKATGRGLAFGLQRLEIDVSGGVPRLRQLADDDAGAWQLHPVEAGPGHLAAIAWRGPPRHIRQWVLADAG